MKKQVLSLVLALVALVGFAAPTFAQTTTVTQTTLSAALDASSTKATLASGTGVAVGVVIYTDREALRVVSTSSPYSTTSPRVARAVGGTLSAAHPSGAIVVVGPALNTLGAGPFWLSDPPLGSCTAATEQYSFRVNITTGKHWKCVNSLWSQVSPNGGPDVKTFPTAGGPIGTVIASAATIAPTSYITHISGTAAIGTITVPAGCSTTCQIVLIPDGIFTTTAAANISLASTAVVNKALIMTWDGTKWNPSY